MALPVRTPDIGGLYLSLANMREQAKARQMQMEEAARQRELQAQQQEFQQRMQEQQAALQNEAMRQKMADDAWKQQAMQANYNFAMNSVPADRFGGYMQKSIANQYLPYFAGGK